MHTHRQSAAGSGVRTGAAALPPPSLQLLARELEGCRACPLFAHATQAVPGIGDPHASVVFVGEQPGDSEDRQGLPFVGPAGRVLERAIRASGLRSGDLYLTNAVKHFKWEARGGRRLHKKPSRSEVVACRPWLERELGEISPRVVVALGATAGSTIFGSAFRVGTARGHPIEATVGPWSGVVVATVHPSAVLRATNASDRQRIELGLVADLTVVSRLCAASGEP